MSKHDPSNFTTSGLSACASHSDPTVAPEPMSPDEAALLRIREEQERQEVTGGCMCGAVRYAARLRGRGYSVCHCSFCRAWSGGPFFSVRTSWFFLTAGEDQVGFARTSPWRERTFCKSCGTHLTYRLMSPDQPSMTGNCLVSLGSLDTPEDLPLRAELYADSRPASYPSLGAPTQVDRATMNARRDAILTKFKRMSA